MTLLSLRIVGGIGQAQFDATVTQKLPLVANDASIFALGAELGWSSAWLNRRQIVMPDGPVGGAAGGHEDVAALLAGVRPTAPLRRPAVAAPSPAMPIAAAAVAATSPAVAAPASPAHASWFCTSGI